MYVSVRSCRSPSTPFASDNSKLTTRCQAFFPEKNPATAKNVPLRPRIGQWGPGAERAGWVGGCIRYYPLFVFNQFGDLERCAPRPGNVHSADGWHAVLEPVVLRYRLAMKRRYFRGDAAFATPDVYEFLEAECYKYVIRLPANTVLQESIAWLLTRPVGRPPQEVRCYHASFSYQAGSWTRPRRVVANVEWHPCELYPRVRFIVTNMTRSAER